MANTKEYKIVINGIEESVKAVESLNKELQALEDRIKSFEGKVINVGVNETSISTQTYTPSKSSLDEEEKLAKKIEEIDAKRAAYSKEIYQNYLNAKDELKETEKSQKSISASERLQAKEYSNTMMGMKQELADIKSAMQNVDLGDGEQFKKMTDRANELNKKLKDIEESYGQFGRNVGNYKSAIEGITITVNGQERTFQSARQAAKELGNELKTMAVNGQQGTDSFKELQKTVAQLNSDIKDATVSSKSMDKLLDTMQSFAAIGSMSQGLSALFGFDDDEIQKSIQKLVALQNVMQSIEKINQQINTQEGIGSWLAKGNAVIDSFISKLTGASKAQKDLNTSMIAGKTASEGLAAAETAQAAATTTATVATKALSLALKSIGIGLIISAVAYLIENWKEIYKWFTDTIPALKNLSSWFDKIKTVVMGVGSAIINFLVQPFVTLVKVIQDVINGDFSKVGKDIANGFKNTFDVVGNYRKGYYKEAERQQAAHNKKLLEQQKKANEEWLKDEEAKYGQSHKRTQEYLKKQMALTEKGSQEYKELQRRLWEDERREREERHKKTLSDTKKNSKEISDAERDLINLRIANMKEGLNKTIKQLEEERRQKLAKILADGKLIGERQYEVNKYYDNKIEEAKKEHAENVEKTYKDMWNNIYQVTAETNRKISEVMSQSVEIGRDNLEEAVNKLFNQGMSSYGVQGKNQLSKSTQIELQFVSTGKNQFTKDVNEMVDLLRKAQIAQNAYGAAVEKFHNVEKKLSDEELGIWNLQIGHLEANAKKYEKLYTEMKNKLIEAYGEENVAIQEQLLLQENYSSRLSAIFEQRFTALENYWEKRKTYEKQAAEAVYQTLVQVEKDSFNAQLREISQWADDAVKKAAESLKKDNLTQKDFEEAKERIIVEHQNRVEAVTEQHNNKLIQLEKDKNNKLKQTNNEYFQHRLQELRDFQTAISNLESKQPVINSWGITNFKKTNENNRNLLESYQELSNQIVDLKKQLQDKLDKNEITFDNFQNANRELDSFAENVGQKMDKVKHDLSVTEQIGQFIRDINQYVQAVGYSLQTILNAVWDAQDIQFDKEQDMLDKYNDKLNESLDKQEDIIQKHKNSIDSIESELATARGQRRQHLIDQINAEMAAQRAAYKEKQKIEKEQKQQEAKQDALNKKRNKAEYKRQQLQAIVSGALAVVNALATQPFMPVGIAMAALAAATTTAQLAIMASNKPYAKGGQLDGGVAVGNRHRDGGIKVLGGRAEIEGGEYITNRLTTQKNVDLLDYINSKKKRIDINDMIDFYSSGKVKKNISSISPKRTFADGGTIPTISNDYAFDDRLLSAFEDYSNRPVVVSVTDINNRQAAVKNVQVLAGLS